jgi:hypothetical protein
VSFFAQGVITVKLKNLFLVPLLGFAIVGVLPAEAKVQAAATALSRHRVRHVCHWQPVKVRVWSRKMHHWRPMFAERRICL